MKKILLISTLIQSTATLSYAQSEYGVGIGGIKPVALPEHVNVITASETMYYCSYNFKLKGKVHLQPQLQYATRRYVMDGAFSKNGNEYEFAITPANHKQDVLAMSSARLPIFLRYALLSSENNPLLLIGIAPYAEFFFRPKQTYKIGNEMYKQKVSLDNKLQAGVSLELSAYGKRKSGMSIHVGAQYQATEYLKNSSSFKPFTVYGKLGLRF